MLAVYINYPNSRIGVHTDGDCTHIRAQRKVGQRIVAVNPSTISQEIRMFGEKKGHPFGSTPEVNDMWMEIDFGDRPFEEAILRYLLVLLGRRYKPFRNAVIDRCC